MEKFKTPLLIFDDKCHLCVRFKMSVERFIDSEKIYFAALSNPDLYQQFPILEKKECAKEVHLIIADNQILKGADVIQYLIIQFPFVKKFAWLLETQMGEKSLTSFYNICNKYRESLLNRCQDCKK